jgi:hypothetical protein
VGTFTLDTTDLAIAEHQLGLSATDSGASVAVTVTRDQLDRIVTEFGPAIRVTEEPVSLPPTITILVPGASDVGVSTTDPLTIQFVGEVNEPDAVGRIDVFYDTDRNLETGYTLIEADLPVSATSVPFPTNLEQGTYFVGATISDGINPPQTVYATGRVIVSGQ